MNIKNLITETEAKIEQHKRRATEAMQHVATLTVSNSFQSASDFAFEASRELSAAKVLADYRIHLIGIQRAMEEAFAGGQ